MKVVLFDIDGTLIKSGGSGARALNYAVERMTGVSEVCELFELNGMTDKQNFDSAFRFGAGRGPSEEELEKLTDIYEKRLVAETELSVREGRYSAIPGVEDLLKFLSGKKDLCLGLGTGNIEKGARIKLEPCGFNKYFGFGGFGEDAYDRAEMLKAGAERAENTAGRKPKPKEVYIIGDTCNDIEAAKENGYRHAAVTYARFEDEKKLFRSGPELIERDFTDLFPWLLWLGLVEDPAGVKRGTYICPDSPIEHAQYGRTGEDSEQQKCSVDNFRKAMNKNETRRNIDR